MERKKKTNEKFKAYFFGFALKKCFSDVFLIQEKSIPSIPKFRHVT